MDSTSAESATRFLILSDPAEIADAQAVVEDRYYVSDITTARTNGIRRAMDGKPVLCWPSATVQAIQAMRNFALELTTNCEEVKFLDASLPLGDRMRPKDFATFDMLADWATGAHGTTVYVSVVPKPDAEVLTIKAGSPPLPDDEQQPSPAASDAPGEPAPMPDSLPIEAYSDDYLTDRSESPRIDDIGPDVGMPWRESDRVPQAAGWPEPMDLAKGIYRALPLPLNLVPNALQPLIADCSQRTGVDTSAYLCGFLGATAGLANDFIRLQPKQLDYKWTVRPVIWPFAIGDASSGKTPALEEAMGWVMKKDHAAVVENTRKRKDYEHLLKQYEDDCAAARKHKQPRPPEPEAPMLREFWVQRGTAEGVTRLLEFSPKIVQYLGEASGMINAWDRYAPGGKGSGDREFYLMLWDGGPGKNTLAGKTISLNNASGVLCGGSTPIAMLSCAGGKLQNDGFLQRTFLSMVEPRNGSGADSAPDEAAYAAYDRILDGLLDMYGTATVKFSPDAQLIYNEFCEQVHALIVAEQSDPMKAHLGKWPGYAARMCLLYFLIDCASHSQRVADGVMIPPEIASQVCRLFMDWQLSHLRAFWYELMAEKTGRKFAQIIARYILANPDITELNFRTHIAAPHWGEFDKLKPWELAESINALVNGSWFTPIDSRQNKYGFASRFTVNPLIKDRFHDERNYELQVRAERHAQLQAKRAAAKERTADDE